MSYMQQGEPPPPWLNWLVYAILGAILVVCILGLVLGW